MDMRTFYFILLVFSSIVFLSGCTDEPIEDPIDEEEDIQWDVTFLDNDGEVLFVYTVFDGSSLKPITPPKIEGYNFIGWDKDLTNIKEDITLKPIYEEITFTVRFISDGAIVKVEVVKYGEAATAPDFDKEGYDFLGWDREFNVVKDDIDVQALWEKQRIIESSYVENLEFSSMTDLSQLIAKIDPRSTPNYTFSNVKEGGARGTNELVYYNETHTFNTNVYGFEVAVDENNIVVEKATKVEIPSGGFVLSAHGTSIDLLNKNTKVGDYLVYENNTVKVFRSIEVSNTLSLGIELNRLVDLVIKSDNEYIPLDYQLIQSSINNAIVIYNNLVENYTPTEYKKAEQLALDINFMLVEPTSVTTRAMWHYPLRAGTYTERNVDEVIEFLEKVKMSGINRVYLNTNFNGRAIYKSEYLVTQLANNNNYGDYRDYLECFIEEAHKLDIEVYAWTNTLISGDGVNNTFYSSRDWVLKGYHGENNKNGMYFIDISNDEVQEFLENVYRELSGNYNLDGIEYDFIRYPNGNLYKYINTPGEINVSELDDFGYTDSFITKFMAEYNLEGDLFELIKTSGVVRTNFYNFKMKLLTSTVEMLSRSIREENRTIQISAAVMPSITTAKNAYLQDWESWIKAGYLDGLEPMVYTADNISLVNQISRMMVDVSDYAWIVAGIFPEGSGGASYMNSEQISLLEELGIAGVSKFSSRTIYGGLLSDSLKYMNRSYIVSPTATEAEILDAYIRSLIDKVENYYIKKDNLELYSDFLVTIESLPDYSNNYEIMKSIEIFIDENPINKVKESLYEEHIKISKYIDGYQVQ